jgi:Mrp family chromosome partitioning ATPase
VQEAAPLLDVLAAGDPTGGAAELLESHRYRALMHALRRKYDCIVVDTSPVLESSEARVVAAQGDLCVFVVRQERTSIFDARQALSVLRSVGTRVLGVLLTDARGRHVTPRRAVASAWAGEDPRPRLRLLSSEGGPSGAPEGDGGRRTWG